MTEEKNKLVTAETEVTVTPEKRKRFSTWLWAIPAFLLILAIGGSVFLFTRNPQQPVSIDELTIVIDPGHGSEQSPGAVCEGIYERDVNWQIALKVKAKLEDRGLKVYLTRGDDNVMVTPKERADFANEKKADLFVSIHQNSVDNNESARGIETWYSPYNHSQSRQLADTVQKAVIGKTAAKDRGIKDDTGLVVTNFTKMPSCLIETGFLTNPEERANLTEDAYQEKLAQGIAEGILSFLSL